MNPSSMVLVVLMLCGCCLVGTLPAHAAATDPTDLVLTNSAASGDDLLIPVVRLAVIAGEEMW